MKKVLFCGLVLLSLIRPTWGASATEVDAAVKKAVDWLYAKQQNGNWENVQRPNDPPHHDSVDGGQWGGLTSIATFALLSAEQSAADDRIKQAVDFLHKAKMRGVYAISMRSQIWPLIPTSNQVKESAKRDAQLLLNGMKNKGNARGMWFYFIDEPKDERGDHSATQFAVLGLWACEEAGVEIPTQFWRMEDSAWREHQNRDGSWAYVYKDGGPWGQPFLSMTCAGLATMFITQDKLNEATSLNCKGAPTDVAITRGLEYVKQQFPADFERPPENAYVPGEGNRRLYLLYGLARLGQASGYRTFGSYDWYKMGTEYLLKTQNNDGSWGNVWETSFGILFLTRGRTPIAYNKLDYGNQTTSKVVNWNQRPRDLANLTTWMGKQAERKVGWQIVDFHSDAASWLDAPVLYISGSEELNFTPEHQQKLKQYVEMGGLVVGNADCGNSKFAASFRKLGQTLFPSYEFSELSQEHPVYTQQQFPRSKWKSKPRVQSLSNGVRELFVLLPDADVSRAYQGHMDRSKAEAYEIAFNFYQYAVGLDELRRKGDTFLIAKDSKVTAAANVKLARIKYPGNWDPEPAGWKRLANYAHNQEKINLTTETVDFGTNKLKDFPLAHLTGTTPIKFSEVQRAELKEYVEKGGTLLIDSAGGGSEFATAMETELNAIFGAAPNPIDAGNKLFTLGAQPLTEFTYRKFARRKLGTLKSSRLRGIEINGRLAVIYSAEDLSAGLMGQSVDGVVGYAQSTALEIVTKVALSTVKK